MTKQPDSVLSLKTAFFACYAARLSVRTCTGAMRGAYLVTLPALADDRDYSRAELVEIGRWLESRGFYEAGDRARRGALSGPDGWTCWNGGRAVYVREGT